LDGYRLLHASDICASSGESGANCRPTGLEPGGSRRLLMPMEQTSGVVSDFSDFACLMRKNFMLFGEPTCEQQSSISLPAEGVEVIAKLSGHTERLSGLYPAQFEGKLFSLFGVRTPLTTIRKLYSPQF
jgi:hypothetical protein